MYEFIYPLSIHDENIEMVKDLMTMFEISYVQDEKALVCSTQVDFKTSPETWVRTNLSRISLGLFPIYTIDIDFSFSDDYARLNGWDFKDIVLKYATYLAYAKLSDSFPIIKSSITNIYVNPDLSVDVALPTYSLVQKLKLYMIEYLNQGISFGTDNMEVSKANLTGKWNIIRCKDLIDGVKKRWEIQQLDPDACPMVFNNGNDEILIHRSRLTIQHPSPKIQVPSLLEAMKKYYSSCHDNLEAVVLEKINDMNLEEILKLVPIEEAGKRYCFLESTISQLEKQENPLTRRPFTEKSILTYQQLENGLRGLFDVGVLYGLYPSVPTKERVEVQSGIPRIARIFVDEKHRDLLGNIFLVEIVFDDGSVSSLFEISLPMVELDRIKILRENVERLWPTGYFLNLWQTAVYLNTEKISINSILDKKFLHAGSSIYDGNVALEALKHAEQNF